MTSRQARTERRAAERKAKKAEMKRIKTAGPNQIPAPPVVSQPAPDQVPAPAVVSHLVPPSRAEINRRNAQQSTGPRTQTGKLASSRNSLKHGLTSGEIIVPGEDRAAFEALLAVFLEEHQPANATEELLVNEIAQSYWLAQRAIRFQNECFTENGVDERRLSLFLRYQTTHDRSFYRALNTLLRLQKERRKSAHGFVSQGVSPIPPHNRFDSQNAPSVRPDSGFVSQHSPEWVAGDATEISQAA